jgi:hypothetical protein
MCIRATIVALEEQYVLAAYSECVFVTFTAILSSVACPAMQYFSTLSHKLLDF